MRWISSTQIMITVTLLVLLFFTQSCFATTHTTSQAPTTKKIIHKKHIVHRAKHVVVAKKHKKQKKKTQTVSKPNIVENPESGVPVHEADTNSTFGQHLVSFVHKMIATLHYSAYKLGGTHFDLNRGIYVVDCSDYVDNVLQAVYPYAYLSLVNETGSDKPTSQHYYSFFSQLADDSQHYWDKIDDVQALQPGDIIVFRYKNRLGTVSGGHVMVVMNKPIRDNDDFLVKVTDSAAVGHSEDTRPPHVSGIGIGTLLLKVNPETGHPYAYAWKVGSRWKKNVTFAMARPLDVHEGARVL